MSCFDVVAQKGKESSFSEEKEAKRLLFLVPCLHARPYAT
jgi:hypothetical protein